MYKVLRPVVVFRTCSCTRARAKAKGDTVKYGRSPPAVHTGNVWLQSARTFASVDKRRPRRPRTSPKAANSDTSYEDKEPIEITKQEVARFTSEILTQGLQTDIMVQSLNRHALSETVEGLLVKGWTRESIRAVFIANPFFLTGSKSQLTKLLDAFGSFGFTNDQIALVLRSGVVAKFKASQLSQSLDVLRQIGIRDSQLPKILTRVPELLTQDTVTITKRVAKLKEMFKTDDIVPLVVCSPNIVFDDWSKIMEIFNYVFNDMGIKQRQMVSAELFRHPLNFVRTRHVFVLRSGFYVKPRKDDDPVRMTNPRLKDIIDTSDSHFAKTFGNMSEKDYKAFAAMMKRDFAKEALERDSDDSEDE